MAFTASEMRLMAYSGSDGGHHLYFYTNSADDNPAGAGFFTPFAAHLRVGDLIFVVDPGQFYRVSAIAAETGAVTVALVIQPSSL